MITKRTMAALALMAAFTTPAVCNGANVEPTPQQQNSPRSTMTVFTKKQLLKKRYHKATCRRLTTGKIKSCKRYQAEEKGFTPCRICNP